MRKIMTLVGTRPELIKLSLIIDKLDKLSHHVLLHTGQNFDYELNQQLFDDLGIRKPDYFLGVAEANAAKTIARVISSADEVFERESPDALLIYGDTNSGLAVISAKRRKIPIFHMEAGNRCFDQRVPEELNRKVIDHLSDVNICLSEHARRYLLAEGFPPERVFKVGSHLPEVLSRFRSKIDASCILNSLELEPGKFFLVSSHREENVDVPARVEDLLTVLEMLVSVYGFPVIVSTHPRTRKRIENSTSSRLPSMIRFLKPFAFTDYAKLQLNAYCVISDSGTITEEASLLDVPAITIRDAHERPEGMDAGTLVMCRLRAEEVREAIEVVRDGYERQEWQFAGKVDDYAAEAVSTKVVRIVFSYIDYVNRVVWSKNNEGDLQGPSTEVPLLP